MQRNKNPLLPKEERIKGKKSNKTKTKKSNHKHEYTWYKIHNNHAKETWKIYIINDIEESNYTIASLCKHCGKEMYNKWIFTKREYDDIIKLSVDITPYSSKIK